jgi:hypothetical protein
MRKPIAGSSTVGLPYHVTQTAALLGPSETHTDTTLRHSKGGIRYVLPVPPANPVAPAASPKTVGFSSRRQLQQRKQRTGCWANTKHHPMRDHPSSPRTPVPLIRSFQCM